MEQLKKWLAFSFVLVILSVLLLSSRSIPAAAVYYISNSGNDGNSGTSQAAPWKTLAKLNSVTLVAGDQVLLNRGNTWIEALPVNQSGASGNPITFGAYGSGANPVVTSFLNVPTWSNQGSNIWVANISGATPGKPSMVLINGVKAPPGRFPNTGWLTMANGTGSSFTSTSPALSTFSGGGEVVIKKREWVIDRCPISSITDSTINFTNVTGFPALDGWGFFFTDSEYTLDQQNEWHYKNGSLKIYSTQNPASLNVKFANLNTLLAISFKSYLKFQNINFEGSKGNLVTISGGTGNQMLDCAIRYGGNNGFDSDNMSNFTMNNCDVSFNNYSGISAVVGTNQTFTNNTITNNGMNPAICAPNNKANHGIWVNGTGTLIQYNSVLTTGYVAIDFSGNNNSVLNNLVRDYCQIVADGGGIYMSDETNGVGRVIAGNIVMYGLGPRDGTPYSGNDNAKAIYLDERSAGVLVQNNFLAYSSGGGIFLHKAHDNIISGNTIYGCPRGLYAAEDSDEDTKITNTTFTGNFIHCLQASDLPYSLVGTPSINNFFSNINNNVLSKPSTTASMVRVFRIIWTGNYDTEGNKIYTYPVDLYTLPQWKSVHPTWDLNSSGTPSDFATGTPLVHVNPSKSPVTVSLDGVYKSIKNVTYNSGSLTLQPYTSEVLIRTADLPPVSNIVNFKGRIIISNGP